MLIRKYRPKSKREFRAKAYLHPIVMMRSAGTPLPEVSATQQDIGAKKNTERENSTSQSKKLIFE